MKSKYLQRHNNTNYLHKHTMHADTNYVQQLVSLNH